jgi:hypothetical protein
MMRTRPIEEICKRLLMLHVDPHTFCVIFRRMSSITGGISGRNVLRGGRSFDRIPTDKHRKT